MTNKQKTILILTPGFPANEKDSNCIPFQQALLLEAKARYASTNFIVFSFQYPYHSDPYLWNDIQVIPFNGRNKGGLQRLMLRQKIKKELRRIQGEQTIIGAVSFWYGECAWAGQWLSQKFELPHYCWIWGQDAKKTNPYPSRLKLKTDELIALSDSLCTEFEKNHKTKISRVIPPGVAKCPYNNMGKKDIDLLAVGSLIPLKRYDIFIELLKSLKDQLPFLKAVIIGKGPERNRLEIMTRLYGLDNNLEIKGELPHDEVLAYMHRSRILLHPSSYEGFSLACLEAIHSGMKVCSFVQPMNASIENWFIVKDREDMLGQALVLLQQKDAAECPAPFPLENTVERLMALF